MRANTAIVQSYIFSKGEADWRVACNLAELKNPKHRPHKNQDNQFHGAGRRCGLNKAGLADSLGKMGRSSQYLCNQNGRHIYQHEIDKMPIACRNYTTQVLTQNEARRQEMLLAFRPRNESPFSLLLSLLSSPPSILSNLRIQFLCLERNLRKFHNF